MRGSSSSRLSLSAKLARHPWRVVVAAALLVAAAYLAYTQIAGPRVPVVSATRRDIVQSVVASGRIATPNRVDIGSQTTGTVSEVPVEQGETVRAGQPLVVLESAEAQASVRQAESAVAQAEARLRQLRELQHPVASQTLRQAEANLANAQAQYERNRQLHEKGFVGKAALDDAERNLAVARTQVESARKQLASATPRGSDYALAVSALDQARASLQAAHARLGYGTIRAPVDGTLIARDVERGDVVQPGKVLMVLAPAGETQIVLQIDERNLGKLRLGEKALASADAYPAQTFAAEVVYINPGVDPQRGTVEVKLRVPDPPAYLRQDMTVSADIEVARHDGTLALPADGVRDATGSAPWVLQVVNGRAVRRPVQLGLRGEQWVEITAGLSAGDLVVPAGSAAIRPGERVRAAPRA